uniref:Uncharacterized protein n=1 Tax=Bionectria ochroleuca TaxID=29856 RepID=A0A0B7K093_BIOOC
MAFCDARSLSEEDLVPPDRVSPQYAGEIYYVRPSEKQHWYWLSNMVPEEVAIFVSFDSACSSQEMPINYCAHVSFNDSSAHRHVPPRESLEVRLIVLTRMEKETEVDHRIRIITMEPLPGIKPTDELKQPWKNMIKVPQQQEVADNGSKDIRLQVERDQHENLGG